MKRLFNRGIAVALVVMFFAISLSCATSASAYEISPSIPVNITGIWNFTSTDYPYTSFTLTLQQSGTKLLGHDSGGSVVKGNVNGHHMDFTVYTGISEDNYGGSGVISTRGVYIAGQIYDGLGGQGTFQAYFASARPHP